MELTIKQLKEIIKDMPDDAVLADLEFGNQRFNPFCQVKRLMLLQDDKGKQYVTINRLGSHFTATGEQKNLSLVPCHEYYGDVLVYTCATTCRGLENCKLKQALK